MVRVREDMTGWKMWEHGVPDSKLIVIKRMDDYISKNGIYKPQWLCECSCDQHNKIIVIGESLKSGHTKSCGCLQKECAARTGKNLLRKENQYDLTGEYGIGWTTNTNREFYFDLEDYDKIKNYCWCEDVGSNGYISLRAKIPGESQNIIMSWLLIGKHYDHTDRNPLNNRKSNLRKATEEENAQNHSKYKNNTSGISGVCWNKINCNWRARITINGKRKDLGSFINKNDAIRERLKAEQKYYKEFAPQRHLFEEYGISTEGDVYN